MVEQGPEAAGLGEGVAATGLGEGEGEGEGEGVAATTGLGEGEGLLVVPLVPLAATMAMSAQFQNSCGTRHSGRQEARSGLRIGSSAP